jgi:serine/threonine protein kinase
MTLQPGEILNQRYQIENVIAQGGMGAVYRANDLTLNIPVAVKENLGGTESYVRQFKREGTVLAGLVHPNLPRVTDHFVSKEGGQYLIMDFIEGEDLREMIKRTGCLPEEMVIRVGTTICDALIYLHTHQPSILHRDIKPGNIKICSDGSIYLVDFGLVKVIQGNNATTTGAQSLTPGYAPPEQYGGGTDQRSDIYSLGATLYAALTGKIPEDGITRAMGNSRLTPIAKHKPKISPKLSTVIEKALSVEPDNRFQTAQQFKEALEGSRIDFETTISVEGKISTKTEVRKRGIETKGKFKPDGKMISLLLAGVTVIILISLSLAFFRPKTAPSIPAIHTSAIPPVETTLHALLPTVSQQKTDLPPLPSLTPIQLVTGPQSIISTPTGGGKGMIAFTSISDGFPQIFLLNLLDGSIEKITNLPSGACQPDWSPDGSRLVFISPCSSDQKIYPKSSMFLIQSDGSGLKVLSTLPGGDFEPDWSPDGNRILFTSLRDSSEYKTGHIYVMDILSENVDRLTDSSLTQRSARWSPDGSQIAYEDNRNSVPQVFIMDQDGNNVIPFTNVGENPALHPAWSPDGRNIVFIQGDSSPGLMIKGAISPFGDAEAINDKTRPAGNPSYSPDGNWLVYESNGEIMIMTIFGENATNLTNSPTNDFDPSWQP